MHRIKSYLLLSLLLCLCSALLIIAMPGRDVRSSVKRIAFSHQKHKDLAECGTCHAAAASELATDNIFPKPEACLGCHEEKDVRKYWNLADDAKVADASLPRADRHLIFSHKFHVEKTRLECQHCHSALFTAADEEAVSGIPEMTLCAECHNNANRSLLGANETKNEFVATSACEACHTTLAGLHPKNHRIAEFAKEHGKFAMMGENEQECAACHSVSFCQECHSPYDRVNDAATTKNFAVPSSPRGQTIDNADRLSLQKRHNLTYRFTHGFDARAQASKCEICHSQETFCTPCHRNGFDEAGIRILPQSHQLAGFASPAPGRANNRHAKLAEMSIEACAVCHNVEGADPICVTCHETGIAPKGGK